MKKWVTKQGDVINPEDMELSHIGNSINYFIKAWVEYDTDPVNAQFDECELDYRQRNDILDRLRLLNKELKRRIKNVEYE